MLGLVMTFVSGVFLAERNMFNTTRNFAAFDIMALGVSELVGLINGALIARRPSPVPRRWRAASSRSSSPKPCPCR